HTRWPRDWSSDVCSSDLPRALRIAERVAAAVAAAHDAEVIHQHLRPGNVFLVHKAGDPDAVKVLDFGMANTRAYEASLSGPATKIGRASCRERVWGWGAR